jgi:hypothetical protein
MRSGNHRSPGRECVPEYGPVWPVVPVEQIWIWANGRKSVFEFLPQAPSAAAGAAGAPACGGVGFKPTVKSAIQGANALTEAGSNHIR